MTKQQLTKLLLKKQAEYRKQGKSAAWLAAYARGFNHRNFSK